MFRITQAFRATKRISTLHPYTDIVIGYEITESLYPTARIVGSAFEERTIAGMPITKDTAEDDRDSWYVERGDFTTEEINTLDQMPDVI